MLHKLYWGCWIIGIGLIILSRQGMISPEAGWAGFYLACGAAVVSRIRWPARGAANESSMAQKLYEMFVETLTKCSPGSGIAELPDDVLAEVLFEDCAPGMHSCFNESSLAVLHDAGYIGDVQLNEAHEIYKQWTFLERRDRGAAAVPVDPEWQRLFEMCDHLLATGDADQTEQSATA